MVVPLTGPNIILILKVAVATVTVLFALSLVALALGQTKIHGRLNVAFAVLTGIAVIGLEVLIRLVDPNLFDYFDEPTRRAMQVHLCFSVPAALVIPVMLLTGKLHRRGLHMGLGVLFLVLWSGTFVTGIFFLPHTP